MEGRLIARLLDDKWEETHPTFTFCSKHHVLLRRDINAREESKDIVYEL